MLKIKMFTKRVPTFYLLLDYRASFSFTPPPSPIGNGPGLYLSHDLTLPPLRKLLQGLLAKKCYISMAK